MSARKVKVTVKDETVVYVGEGEDRKAYGPGQEVEVSADEAKQLRGQGVVKDAD